MTLKRRTFNPKRRIRTAQEFRKRQRRAPFRLENVLYRGNPEHKRAPGDFGLTPPASPRPNKTLCDRVEIFSRAEALKLLISGFERGLVSEQERDGWPQNVWAVTDKGEPLEAQLEGNGVYHGYPMPEGDPFREKVLEHWASR